MNYEEQLETQRNKAAFMLFNIDYEQLSASSKGMCNRIARHVLAESAKWYKKGCNDFSCVEQDEIRNNTIELGLIEEKK